MAKWAATILTNPAGLNLLAKGQAGKKIEFTRIVLGDGGPPGVSGTDLNSGTLSIGKIYKILTTETDHFYSGCQAGDIFAADVATPVDANNTVKDLTVELEARTGPINQKQEINVQSYEMIGDGTVRIRGVHSNDGLATGYEVRELNFYANDPDIGEILYAVTNAGIFPDALPAEGGATVVEMTIDALLKVDNAEIVTATITPSTPATVDDLDDHNLDPHAHPPIQERIQQVEAEAWYFSLSI